ncbi:MAG: signal peptidase II [Gammaproteobacteria bacterium]|nr:signal peptidase II [Gammaproteobacteria bacterium]
MPEQQTNTIKQWAWISLLVILLDQASKLAADAYLNYHQPVSIIPMFNLTLMYNKGAAFSFLSNAGGWQRWFFIVVSLTISIVLIVWLSKLKTSQKLQTTSIALILGGAIGNLIDRSIYGYVIDFIDVFYQQHHWPAFNIADSAITIGAILLIIDSFKNHEQNSGQ